MRDQATADWLRLDASSEDSDRTLQALLNESRLTVRDGFRDQVMAQATGAALDALLREERIEVREGFKDGVTAALPVPAWRKAPARFAPLVAAAAVFAGVAAFLLAGAGPGHGFAAGGAMVDLLTAAIMAGAGLFTASWSGLGTAVGQFFTADAGTLIGFGAMALFVNLLFFSLLRRRRTANESVSSDP